MICAKCGNFCPDHASFCGQCGTALYQKENGRYAVHKYDPVLARKNKAYLTLLQLELRALLLVPLVVLGAAALGMAGDSLSLEWMLAGTLGLSFGLCAAVIGISVRGAVYVNAGKMTFVEDTLTRTLYRVTFVGEPIYGATTAGRAAAAAHNNRVHQQQTRIAQRTDRSIQVVSDYIAGTDQPTAFQKYFSGVPVKVEQLNHPCVVSRTQKNMKLRYENAKGRSKAMTVPNAFPTLRIQDRRNEE